MFTLRINTDNAAFDGGDLCEVARILRQVADKLDRGHENGTCRDCNGNDVGSFDMHAAD